MAAAALILSVAAMMSLCVTSTNGFGTDKVTRNVSMTMKFVVSVNASWNDCLDTVSTPLLHSDRDYNQTEVITVGQCDKGPLTFYVTSGSRDGVSRMDVTVTFYTSQISAMPPQCTIPGMVPTSPPPPGPLPLPLPGCWTSDSQEGWHLMDFYFWILDWNYL